MKYNNKIIENEKKEKMKQINDKRALSLYLWKGACSSVVMVAALSSLLSPLVVVPLLCSSCCS
jgi:hypothetical protein